MELSRLIGPGQVLVLRPAEKAQLLQDLARRAARPLGIDPASVLDALHARESLGSTGVGQGIALPHARLSGLDRVFALFARLESPIEFEAVDGKPVDLVFLLLLPADAEKEHLATLAAVARRLRDSETARRLRSAAEPKAIYAALTGADEAG